MNVVAICSIAVLFSKMFDVGCYSHTLDRVGEKMNTPLLDEFHFKLGVHVLTQS